MKKEYINNANLLKEYMESVEGMREAETAPFFYTRLVAKKEKQQSWVFPVKPVWIIGGMMVLLVLNGLMAISLYTAAGQNTVATASPLQNFAAAYDLTIQTTY